MEQGLNQLHTTSIEPLDLYSGEGTTFWLDPPFSRLYDLRHSAPARLGTLDLARSLFLLEEHHLAGSRWHSQYLVAHTSYQRRLSPGRRCTKPYRCNESPHMTLRHTRPTIMNPPPAVLLNYNLVRRRHGLQRGSGNNQGLSSAEGRPLRGRKERSLPSR